MPKPKILVCLFYYGSFYMKFWLKLLMLLKLEVLYCEIYIYALGYILRGSADYIGIFLLDINFGNFPISGIIGGNFEISTFS